MVVDVLRSAYTTRCRFFRNSPIQATIRWYRCQPGAQVMPGVHAFGSRNWLTDHSTSFDIGEVAGAPRPWDRGVTIPGATGTHRCGTADEWRNGVVYPPAHLSEHDANGLSTCCPGAGPPVTEDDLRDINFWKNVATPTLDRWYSGGSPSGSGGSISPAIADFLIAIPFFPSRGGVLNKIGIWLNVEGDPGALLRAAIYDSVSDTDLTPLNLLADSGDLVADIAPPSPGNWLEAPIALTLNRLNLYWLVLNANTVGSMPLIGVLDGSSVFNVWGYANFDIIASPGIAVAFPYAAPPAIFPAFSDINLVSSDLPLVAVKYSA
jgi:hypothetical protein